MKGRDVPAGAPGRSSGSEEDVLLLVSALVPLIVVGRLFASHWGLAVAGLAVGLVVGGLVLWRAGDALAGVLAGGVAPLLVVWPLPVLAVLGLVLGGAVVLVILLWGGGWPLRVAVALVAVAGTWATRSPAPLVGLAVALPLRWVATHPTRARLARAVRDLGLVAAALPALGLFVLAAIDRVPAVSGDVLVGAGWGIFALGLLVFAAAWGAEWLFAASPPDAEAVLGLVAVGAAAVVWALVAGTFGAAVGVAACVWMVMAYPAALGLRRVLGVAGRWRLMVVLGVVVAVAIAGLVRPLVT